MTFEKTYQMAPGEPPAPMDGATYKAAVEQQWTQLLATDPWEKAVQLFLEQHPVLVPGAFGVLGLSSGHAPFPGALISQPKLYGFQGRVPDFLWISKNSTHLNPIFIEIERPGKKVFKADGDPTWQFTQARHQLAQWRQWIKVPNNQDAFFRAYQLDRFRDLTFEPHYVLIYGRREEFADDTNRLKMMGSLMAPDETLMSYDRLSYEPKSDQLLSVRHTSEGYQVRHIPPTYWLGPGMFHYAPRLLGRSAAVDHNPLISAPRKEFLKSRIPYWEVWEKLPSGITSGADRE
jgi:hypothetical protein